MYKNALLIAFTTLYAFFNAPAFSKDTTNTLFNTIATNAQFFGRVHIDANWYDKRQADNHQSNDVSFARARLGVKGKISNNLSYNFENDFAENLSEIKDAYIAYTGFKNSTIFLGQTKPTFSLEILESSNHMSFIQRAAVSDDAVLRRKTGITANKRGENWRIAAGIYGESLGNQPRSNNSKYSVTARASTTPIKNNESLLHLGIATSFTSRDQNTDTTTKNTLDKELLIGGELIARYKSFTLQSEYILNQTKYDGDANAPQDVNFPGYYIQASFFVTGEHRKYNVKDAKLGKINIKRTITNGGIGALELAARFSQLDKNDGSVLEGKSTNYTLGINWHPHTNLRFMLNYLHSDTDYAKSQNRQTNNTTSLRMICYF